MEIHGYENYLIYNDGRVFGKKRNKLLKPRTNSRGYKHLTLHKGGKRKTHNIHRLIAEHYIDNPENKRCVDHINRIRTDNRIENLRWATYSENGQNKTLSKKNTTGHKYVSYSNRDNKWQFQKSINKKISTKSFKTKTDALCYKFIFMLKVKAKLS